MNRIDDDDENNIRPPDEVLNEQLLQDNRSEFEKQIDEAIYLSAKEIREKKIMNMQYEELLMKEYDEKCNKRKQIFEKLLFDLKKVGKVDKEVMDVYEIIEPIIESYCYQRIDNCELDCETYKKIFNLLSKIRTDKYAVELLRSNIIKYELH